MQVTAEDIAQLLASPPPRTVAPQVAKAAAGGRGVWGGVIFGLLFGAFGSVFLVFFFPWRMTAEIELGLSGRPATGHIVSQDRTNFSVNHVRVVRYQFEYTTEEGARQQAECFTTGSQWADGTEVGVHYLPRDPAVACIDGARLNQAGWWAGFVVIFPLIGFGIASWAVTSRRRLERLLRSGTAIEVDVTDVQATKVRINYQTVYKITVAAPGLSGGQPVTIKRWAQPDVNLATQRALQKQPVFVLFDPARPTDLVFPEGWIGR